MDFLELGFSTSLFLRTNELTEAPILLRRIDVRAGEGNRTLAVLCVRLQPPATECGEIEPCGIHLWLLKKHCAGRMICLI
jgi:hypothetical protein